MNTAEEKTNAVLVANDYTFQLISYNSGFNSVFLVLCSQFEAESTEKFNNDKEMFECLLTLSL